MRLPLPLLACLLLASSIGVSSGSEAPEPPAAPAKVLLLGTFHFKDAGLDDYRPQYDVDILSEERQTELDEVVRCLESFRPTKIAVEAMPEASERLNQHLDAYLAGELELPADELYQLGFRLAERLSLSEVHPVDAEGQWYEPYVDPEEWAVEAGQADALMDSEGPWVAYYDGLYAYRDRAKTEQTLRQHLHEINREEEILRGHGRYLIGTFKVGRGDQYPGVDAKIGWYTRNLRIFANLHRILSGPDDRLLLIIGSGHLPLLRHAVEASPQLELVEAGEYLSEGCGGAEAPGG